MENAKARSFAASLGTAFCYSPPAGFFLPTFVGPICRSARTRGNAFLPHFLIFNF